MGVALSTMVDAAIAHSPADGIAVGTVHGNTAEFVCRGRRLAYAVTASATTQAMLSGAPCAYARSLSCPATCSGSAGTLSAACSAPRSTTADSPSEQSR